MYIQTIYGTKFKIKNNLKKDEIINEISKKFGYDKSKIYLYDNFFGVFNTNNSFKKHFKHLKNNQLNLNSDYDFKTKNKTTDNSESNVYSKYGVPDYIYNYHLQEERLDYFLDYEKMKIVSYIHMNIPEELSQDKNLTAKIFKHFLCENNRIIEVEQTNIDSYVRDFINEDWKSFNKEDKEIINKNLEEIIKNICKKI